MITLPNRDGLNHLNSYVVNFERFVIAQIPHRRDGESLDDLYNRLIDDWGGFWTPDGFKFDNDTQSALFLLRWS